MISPISNFFYSFLFQLSNCKFFYWQNKYLLIKKVENTVSWTYAISDFQGEEIVGMFYEKELQKINQKEFRVEKVIKRKDDKLYVKWKGYNDSYTVGLIKKT